MLRQQAEDMTSKAGVGVAILLDEDEAEDVALKTTKDQWHDAKQHIIRQN